MKGFCLFLMFMFVELAVVAQTKGYDIIESNKDIKISLTDIRGIWHSVDSSSAEISFVKINDYFVDIEGIKHGVGNYSFRVYGDSISVNGSAANWPPYNCSLKLLDATHLEIEFYQFLSTSTTKSIYVR